MGTWATPVGQRIMVEDEYVPRLLNEPFDRRGKSTVVVDTAEEAIDRILKPDLKFFVHTGRLTVLTTYKSAYFYVIASVQRLPRHQLLWRHCRR
jgi:hypothetical protein